jgi:hypothetical protein
MKNVLLFAAILLSCFASAQDLNKEGIATETARIIRGMEIYHTNAYHYTDSTDIAAYRAILLNDLPEQPTKMEAYRALNKLVCAFGDGHTRLWDYELSKAYRENGGLYFPLAVDAQEGELTVRKDYRGSDVGLAGKKILSINGMSATRMIEEMSAHASRETAALDRSLLSRNFGHYLWLTYDLDATNFVLEVEGEGTVNIVGLTKEAIKANAGPEKTTLVIETKLLENNIAYLRVRHFEGVPKAFKKLFKEAFATINASGADRLILDLRDHGGGDSRVGDDLARYISDGDFRQFAYSEWKATPAFKQQFKNTYLPKAIHWAIPMIKGINPHTKAIYSTEDHANARVEHKMVKPYGASRAFQGEVVLLMDNNTFSAGTCFAAMFKDYGMGTIIGQESGNLANFHADGLMKMGIESIGGRLQISNSYLVRPSGDETAQAVQPDIALDYKTDAFSFAIDFFSGVDKGARTQVQGEVK